MQDKVAELEFFSKQPSWEVLTEESYEKLIKYFCQMAAPKTFEKILDLGCGSGSFTSRLAQTFPNIIGIDISPELVGYAKKRTLNVIYRVGDIENLDIPANSVDVCALFGVLHHFENIENVMREVYRVLKKGGRFWSYDPHKYNPAFFIYRDSSSPFMSKIGRTENERLVTKAELKNVCTKVGFVNINTKIISGITHSYIHGNIAQMLLPIYNLWEILLGFSPFARFIGSYVLSCGIK